jgi:hypothetical protein
MSGVTRSSTSRLEHAPGPICHRTVTARVVLAAATTGLPV